MTKTTMIEDDGLLEPLPAMRSAPNRKPRFLDGARFVAWDGEGESDPDGAHRYTLLANSKGDYIEAPSLATKDCLLLLLDVAARFPGAKHVIFSGSYDVTMMLRDIDPYHLALLYDADERGIEVTLDGRRFAIGYRRRKCLYLAELAPGRKRKVLRSMRLWDVWGFFQGSFVSTGHEWFGSSILAEVPLWNEIVAMKERRADFADESPERVRAYCFAECEALEKLCLRLAEALRFANIHPARFDGPGALAAAVFKREGLRDHIAPMPAHLDRATRCAYAGGRIEITTLGAIGTAHGYDIRSAYPSVCATLPSMLGAWRKTDTPQGHGLARVSYHFPNGLPWYPLFFRNHDGTILFPQEGEGWYHFAEVRAALRFASAYGGIVRIKEAFAISDDGSRPFSFVPALFEQRRILKQERNAAEKVIKLVLNSLYGKLASQLGGSEEKAPPYFSQFWAGAITAGTRARMVEAGICDLESIVMFATDGIYSRKPLNLGATPGSGALGTWEEAGATDSLVVAQAGVYWVLSDQTYKAKYRGFDRRAIATPHVALDAWARGQWEATVEVTRFATLGTALARGDMGLMGTWETAPRVLDLSGVSSKRQRAPGRARPHKRPVRLHVAFNYDRTLLGAISAPYPRAWETPRRLAKDRPLFTVPQE